MSIFIYVGSKTVGPFPTYVRHCLLGQCFGTNGQSGIGVARIGSSSEGGGNPAHGNAEFPVVLRRAISDFSASHFPQISTAVDRSLGLSARSGICRNTADSNQSDLVPESGSQYQRNIPGHVALAWGRTVSRPAHKRVPVEMATVDARLGAVLSIVQTLNVKNWIGKTIVALQCHYPIYLTLRKN